MGVGIIHVVILARKGEHSGVTTQMVRFSKVVRSIERPKWPQIDLNHGDRHHKMIIQSALLLLSVHGPSLHNLGGPKSATGCATFSGPNLLRNLDLKRLVLKQIT